LAKSQDEKKAEEEFYLRRLLKAIGLDSIAEPDESPDFVLKREASVVGVEVTRLFHSAAIGMMPRQAAEQLRTRVVKEAERLYVAGGHPPVLASVHFNPSHGFKKGDVPHLAQRLLQLVLRNMPAIDSRQEEEYEWENREWFPEEFHLVSVARLSVVTQSHWSAPDAAYAPTCSPELVQERVSEKAAKISSYSSKVPECWLLVVADDFWLSGSFQFPPETLQHEYVSPFNRLFLLEAFGGEVHELRRVTFSRYDV
jgi:hypothetical protein